jgi:hypothetical protein
MSLIATLFPKEYTPGFKVIGTKKHTQFSEKKPPPIKREVCPYPNRSKEAGQWHRNQTLRVMKENGKAMTIYQILNHTLRPQSAQQKTLDSLIFDGKVYRSQPTQNKNIAVLYWLA